MEASSNLSSSRPNKIYTRLYCCWDIIHRIEYCSQCKWQSTEIYNTDIRHSIFIVSVCRIFFSFFFYRCCSRCCTYPQASTFEYISRASARVRTTNRFILLTTTIQLAAHPHIKRCVHFCKHMSVCAYLIVDDSPSAQYLAKTLSLSLSLSLSFIITRIYVRVWTIGCLE